MPKRNKSKKKAPKTQSGAHVVPIHTNDDCSTDGLVEPMRDVSLAEGEVVCSGGGTPQSNVVQNGDQGAASGETEGNSPGSDASNGQAEAHFAETDAAAETVASAATLASSEQGSYLVSESQTTALSTAMSSNFPIIRAAPACGTAGQPVNLWVNVVNIDVGDATFYQYDVDIRPVERSARPFRDLNRKIVAKMLGQNRNTFTGVTIYDGEKLLVSNCELDEARIAESFKIEVDTSEESPQAVGIYQVTVQKTKMAAVQFSEIDSFCEGGLREYPFEVGHLGNLVVKEAFEKTELAAVGRCDHGSTLYDYSQGQLLDPKQEQWYIMHRSFTLSIRPVTALKTALIVSQGQSVFYNDGGEEMCLTDFIGQRLDVRKLERDLRGLRIVCKHQHADDGHAFRRTHVVNGITANSASKQTFKLDDGGETIVAEYYVNTYQLRLKHPDLPCVLSKKGPIREVYIPLELCYLLPYQPIGDRNTRITAEMIKRSATVPEVKFGDLYNFLRDRVGKANTFLRDFGLGQIVGDFLKTTGRVLPPPVLKLNGTPATLTPRDGSWNLSNSQKFSRPCVIRKCYVLNYTDDSKLAMGMLGKFFEPMVMACQAKGISGAEALYNCDYRPEPPDALEQFKEIVAKKEDSTGVLVICLLEEKNTAKHRMVKCAGDQVYGLVTQCLVTTNFYQPKPSYIANVVLKINAKMGGENWCVQRFTWRHARDRVMILGADVTHASPQAARDGASALSKSLAAVVASINANHTLYTDRKVTQVARDRDRKSVEEILAMRLLVGELLDDFRRANGHPPSRVIYFRDGVSEGEHVPVTTKETAAIMAAFADAGFPEPRVTVVIATKRHAIRAKPVTSADGDTRHGNVRPGTVMDRDVVEPWRWSFYLTSHAGILGTSHGTRYTVLHDTNEWPGGVDELQAFTYELAHLWQRATKAVSIPAPVYHAHSACKRGREYVTAVDNRNGDVDIHPNLRERMPHT